MSHPLPGSDSSGGPPALSLQGITKRFGPLLANDGISLTLARGEILALLGENGAGKSTLMSILFGHYVADSGRIEVFGQPLPPGQPRRALQAGIGMVHQHFTLADNLSVLDNVMLGTESLWRLASSRAAGRARLLDTARRFRLAVDPDARVGDLSVGERQRVEILKALYRDARILILDEPTAVLTPRESEDLFETLAQMVAQGLSIVFISHKLAEVLRVSHRVAVLRAGRLVATAAAAETSAAELANWMVGRAVERPGRQPAARQAQRTVCELRGACSEAGSRDRLDQVDLRLDAGEIVAVAGVSGNGQRALADVLCGMRPLHSGQALYAGAPLPARVADGVNAGIARVPEDRHGTGVVGDLPLWENAVAERLRSPALSRWGWIRRQPALRYVRRILETFDVRGGGPMSSARLLSGGNMQKLILGRALLAPDGQPEPPARLIVAHQPTWGLDVGAVAFVHRQLFAARDAGAAILVISDDLDEVMLLGDRIAVMHEGRLSAAREAAQWSRETLGLAMAGTPPTLEVRP
ncbi:MAG: ABC transporter ATP-binding protein [Comamonas sp.]